MEKTKYATKYVVEHVPQHPSVMIRKPNVKISMLDQLKQIDHINEIKITWK
jgi:hypothetical protein